ncbi:MAG: aldo/keto reductase [Thermoplasmata archaeon]
MSSGSDAALGHGGVRVSSIGFGTWQAGDDTWGPDVNDRDCAEGLARGATLGINLVDTAENYGRGHAEEVVGRAVRIVGRKSVFVATKVSDHHLNAENVVRACRGSLKRMGIRHIDLYQIHWTDPYDQVPLRETMRAMEHLQREGVIEHIGVSNFAVRDLEEARSSLSRTDIVSNQVQYNLFHREIEAEVLPYCSREGITVLAYSPLARGLLSGKYDLGHRPTDQVRTGAVLFKPKNLRAIAPVLRKMARIGRSRGWTSAQVALGWLRSHPGVIPIPGIKRPSQADELAPAASIRLGSGDRRILDSMTARLHLDTF